MSLTTFVGQKLSFKNETTKPSAGVTIAVAGIAVSFIIMLLSISVVRGFKNEIINTLCGFNPQISILPPAPADVDCQISPLRLTQNLKNDIRQSIPEATFSLTINQPAVFKTDSAFQGVVLRGLQNQDWMFARDHLIAGNIPSEIPDTARAVVISKSTSLALGVDCGQQLITHFFDGNTLRTRKLEVTGIYDSHFDDFDRVLAFVPIGMLQEVFSLDSISGTAIEIRGIETASIPHRSASLYETLLQSRLKQSLDNDRQSSGGFYRVDNMMQQCALYINWLNLLDTNVIVIIILMACVAGFTLISSLFIIVLERVRLIGLFKALGATNRQIRSIFIFMIQRLVVRGLIVGNIIGVGIILLQSRFHILPLTPDAYYLDYVPMDLSLMPIIVLNLCVIVISAIILIVPSCII
ncbi:MAG: hypothetical protein K2G01_02335, partial [Paramuribaculum sp.]|nr:hypothetical protein [Paramuribaculum sp.]